MEDEAGLGQTAMCHAPSCADQGGKMQDSMGLQSCSASFTKAMLEEEWYMAGAGDNSIMDDMKQLAYSASSPLQLPLTMPLSDSSHGGPSIFGQLDGSGTHFQPFLPPGRSMAAGFGRDDRSSSGMSLSSLLDGALTFEGGFIGGFPGGGGGSGVGGGYSGGGGSQLDVLADLQDGVQVGQSHVGVLSGFGMAGGNLMCATAGNGLSPGRVHNVGMSNLSPRSPLGGLSGDSYGGSMNGGIGNMLANGLGGGGGGFGGFGTPLSGNGGGYGDPFANSLMRSFGAKDGVVTSAMLLGGGGGGSSDKLQQHHQLRPLGVGPPQTLFQKRAAKLAAGSSSPSVKSGPRLLTANASPCDSSVVDMTDQASPNVSHNKRKAQAPAPRLHDSLLDDFGMAGDPGDDFKDEDDLDESGDGSVLLYETASDEMLGLDGACQGLMSSGVAGEKGKGKKGLPAKNLMAERRRRKKLNERLYTLRSVVPNITKMDRASILGDAIEHLRSLLQQISDLHQELENPPERQLPPSPSGLLPSSSNLGCRVKEEFPTPLPSPDSQAARVQVVIREGRTLNIHMFCARRPGLLLSTMRALDGLGLDVQQAVISCFNGFALDVFRAEQLKEVEVGEDEIRRVLLRTAGCLNPL